MTHDVFVSYSSKDKVIADAIVASMENNNIRCWYAPRDIKPSEDWGQAITNAIQNSKVFLIIFSAHANRSQRVLDELNFAISKELKIFPFRIENLEPVGAMGLHLSSRHWLDAYDPSWESHIGKLISEISALLELSIDDQQIALPDLTQIKVKQGRKKPKRTLVGIAALAVLITLGWIGWPLLTRQKNELTAQTVTGTPSSEPETTATIISGTPSPSPKPTATPIPTPEFISSKIDGMVQVYVPEGAFLMGSNEGWDDEKPVHTVYLDAFWIDQTEVTNAMYKLCVDSGRCNQPDNKFFTDSNYQDHPVVNVSWYDAQDYCAWAGRRLPSEAEWEKAARGLDGRTYPWGEELNCDLANYQLCGKFPGTSPVSYYGPESSSPFGAFDLAGNAMEWVEDWYEDDLYLTSHSDNPDGPTNGSTKVLRGGSYQTFNDGMRSAIRKNKPPDISWDATGFRCAVSETP